MRQKLGGGRVRDWGPMAPHILVHVYGGQGLGTMVPPLGPGQSFYSIYSPGRVAQEAAGRRERREPAGAGSGAGPPGSAARNRTAARHPAGERRLPARTRDRPARAA